MNGRRRQGRQNSNATVDFEVDADTRGLFAQMMHEDRNEQLMKFNFADFESILRKFSGDGTMSVKKWLGEFEQYADTFRWNDLQKFIFCKRSLIGAAKIFIDCEAKPQTYYQLKSALIQEFLPKITSADVHNKLRNRKKASEETFREYLYHMIDIASQADVEEPSIIEYTIEGIRDYTSNKSILYGVRTIKEFKERLEIYEKITKENKQSCGRNNERDKQCKREAAKTGGKPKTKRFCFNCGSAEHEFHSCPHKEKGPKCFGCNQYGHKKTECPKEAAVKKSSHVIVKNSMYVSCKINDYSLESLVDTGSDICVIKERYLPAVKPKYYRSDSRLSVAGLGANVMTKGSCIVKIEIDGEIFENVEFHIVNDNFLKPDAIIGMSLLQLAVVRIEGGVVNINKRSSSDERAVAEFREVAKTCFLAEIAVDALDKTYDFPDVSHLTEKRVKEKVFALMENYTPEAPAESPIQMKIVTVDDIPVYRPPRRFPPKEQKIIEDQIKEWLNKGIIRESCSDYASQVVLVKKKDGSHRLCVDYRNINRKIHKDRYPLPNIEDQVDRLQGSKYFTTLDLENGFFHVAVEESSRKFTSFVTRNGQYEFIRVPFGLCNSPSVFQKYINYILRELINAGVVVIYLDDIVIPSVTIEEGLNRFEQVLQVAARNGLKIKWRKCQILQEEIEYLGYRVSNGHISPSAAKTKAILSFPVPTTVKQLQSFLGLASYFRKFIRDFATKAKPLSDLLKKENNFKLEEKQLEAIRALKEALAAKPVLKIFEYGVDTELHTDASKEGYGAVLLQRSSSDNALHPVHFMSRKTTCAQKRYTSYELEILAVVEAIKRFRIYLLGQKFKLVTDCKAFEATMKKRDLATRVARWALLLEEFDYTVEHRAGSRMKHVDALSRNPISMCIESGRGNSNFLKNLKEAQQKDDRLRAITEILQDRPYRDYIMHNNILCKEVDNKLLFVVPDIMITEVIRAAHERGHFHYRKMKEILEKEYFIRNLRRRIENHIQGCVRCILAERKRGKPEGQLQPIPKGDQPLQTFHIDHLGPMQNTKKNYRYIFAVIDGFTKHCWLFPTKTLNTEEVIQKLESVAETFGYPERIVADHGGAFTSNNFQNYCKEHDIKLIFVTVGVPRGNGQVERLHSTVIAALTKLSLDDPERWYRFVKPLQKTLNSTFQRTIQTTPFHLLVGTRMRTDEDVRIMEIIEEEWRKEFQDGRQELREQARKDLIAAQTQSKQHYDKKRREARKYQIGDLVAIERVQFGTGLKIRPKFLGPYKITAIKAFDRYKVIKEGNHEGPNATECSVDKMKPWPEGEEDVVDEEGAATDDEEDEEGEFSKSSSEPDE